MEVSKFSQDPPPVPAEAQTAPKAEVRRLAPRAKGDETPEGLEQRARAFYDEGKLAEAFDILESGARRFVDRGLVHEALHLFDQALILNPGRADLHEEMAKTYQQLGRFDAALTSFEGALAAYLNSDRPEQARLVLERMMRFDLEDPNKCHQLSRACRSVGMTDKAVALLSRCLDHYEQEKKRAKFLETAEELLAMTPDDETIRARVVAFLVDEASVFLRYRLFDKSIQGVREALEWDAASVSARELLVEIYEKAGRKGEAVQAILDLARTTRAERTTCEAYLWQAVEMADAPVDVFDAARELGFNLFKMGAASLDDEPTNTADDTLEREIAQPQDVIANTRYGSGLLKLLKTVETIQVASALELRGSESGKTAQLFVQNGAVVFGVCFEGSLILEGERREADKALWEALEQCQCQGASACLDTVGPLARSPRTRQTLRRITASGLLHLARAFTGESIEVEAKPCDTLPTALSFSVFDILKLCVAIEAGDKPLGPASDYFRAVAEEVEQAWLIRRNALGQPIPLPEQAIVALHTSVMKTESLGLAISRIAALTERLQLDTTEKDASYLVLITREGPWVCVIDADTVALVLTRTAALGMYLHRAQAYVEGKNLGEVAS